VMRNAAAWGIHHHAATAGIFQGDGASLYTFPSDYSAHWKAGSGVYSDAGTTPITDGGLVYQWSSQNGSHPLLQATSGNRPTYTANVLNGQPSVDFGSLRFMGTAALQNNTCTVAMLIQLTAATIFNIIWDAASTNVRSIYKPTADYASIAAYSPTTQYNGLTLNSPTLLIVRYEVGVAWQVRINQANAGNFTCNSAASGPSRFASNAGSGVGAQGMKLFEAMEYPRVLSDAEVLQVEAYFDNRFNL
jgi:hypothetical protein